MFGIVLVLLGSTGAWAVLELRQQSAAYRDVIEGEAASVVIAEQTTTTHVGRILAKLDLRDRAQAVVFAYETGLVTPGGSGATRADPATGPDQ